MVDCFGLSVNWRAPKSRFATALRGAPAARPFQDDQDAKNPTQRPPARRLWISKPSVWTYGQAERGSRWRASSGLAHMPTLRRLLNHKGYAYGLTRFACQTAGNKKDRIRVRGQDLPP